MSLSIRKPFANDAPNRQHQHAVHSVEGFPRSAPSEEYDCHSSFDIQAASVNNQLLL